MKLIASMIAVAVLFSSLSGCSPPLEVAGELQTSPYRALSLSALQTAIRSCPQTESCSQEVLQLGDLKRIIGVVSDESTGDLILLGETAPDLPPLYLDDFVVALRNVWLNYAPLKGDVYQYTHPGCSIDPNADVIRKLEAIEQQIHRAPLGSVERHIAEWRRVCEQPQGVSVLGIPFNSRFASTMVAADYDMKTLADGTNPPDVPSFAGITEMISQTARRELAGGRPVSVHSSGMNRFWFYPGDLLLEEDQGITAIKQCPVRLLTERMYLSAGGKMAGTNTTDEHAQVFADNVTALYDKIASHRRVYRELENLFRFVAVANIIKHSYSPSYPRFKSDFLAGYRLSEKQVQTTLPGRHAVKEMHHREDTDRGYRMFHLWIPSCGGVDIAIDFDAARIQKGGRLSLLRAAVMKAKKSAGQLFWNFPDDSGLLADMKNKDLIRRVNSNSKEFRIITVEDKGSAFKVSDGEWNAEYPINKISELWNNLAERAAADSRNAIYLDPIGFESKSKIDALATSLRLQERAQKTSIQVRLLPRVNGSPGTLEAISLPGIMLETPPTVEKVTKGQYTGWSRIVINAKAQVKGVIKRIVVLIYVKSPEATQRILEAIGNRVFNIDFRAESVLDFVNGLRKKMRAYGVADDDIDFEIEFEEKFFVWLRRFEKTVPG